MTAFAIGDTVRCIAPSGVISEYDLSTETDFIVRWSAVGGVRIEGSDLIFMAERFVKVDPE